VWALLALWMCLLATGATGESMIEVDENGDEYELKRFYIQGRQLRGDGSQSQCVVTRRKRSGRGIQSGSVAPGSVSVSSQPLTVESLPAKEHREGGAVLQEVENSNRRFVALTGVHLESPVHQQDDHDAEENDDDDDQEDDEVEEQSSKSQSNYVPAALALPLQSQTSAAHLNQGVSVVANAASHANVGEDAGIVVVQSHQPPKVNPDTHAVFELKPVQSDVDHHHSSVGFYPFVQPWEVVDQHEDDYDEDDYDEEDYDDFYYGGGGFYRDPPGFHGLGAYEEEIISEDQPISTVASWVTGEDDSDIRPVVNKRPNQKNKNKNQKIKNQKNQNQKNQNQKNKRKQEAQGEEQPAKRKQKKPLQDKGQKKKQDKDQKKKKPEESPDNQEMDELTPIDVIKKPVAMESTSAVAASSSSTSTSASNSSASNSTDQKKKKKKKQPSSTSSSSLSQRKTKKKKKQSSSSNISSSNSNRRRRPSSNIGSSSGSSGSSSSIGGYRRRRPQQQLQQQRRRKTQQQQKRRRQQQQQKRRRQQQQKRRRLQNNNRQFYGDEPIINCIYINKDPPTTTTARPFWNILGRQSETESSAKSVNPVPESSAAEESQVDPVAQQAVLQAVRRNFGEFGGRKRTNLRFVS